MCSFSRAVLSLVLVLVALPAAAARIWFVDNSRSAGDGSSSAPFADLASAEAASADGDTIRLAPGRGPYSGPIHLKNGQTLAGSGGRPIIDTAGNAAIVLASANTIESLALRVSGGTGIDASGAGAESSVRDVTVDLTGGAALLLHDRTGTLNWTSGAIRGSGLALKVRGGSGRLALRSVAVTIEDAQAVDVRDTAIEVMLESISAVAATRPVQSAVVVQNSTAPFSMQGGRIEKMVGRAIFIADAVNVSIRNVTLHENASNGVSGSTCGGDLISGDNSGCNAAVFLRNVQRVSLEGVRIDGSAQAGINGMNVTDFTIRDSEIVNAGNEAGEHAMNFRDLVGHSTFSRVTVRASGERALNIENGTGEATIEVAESTLGEPAPKTANQGVLVGVHGVAKMTLAFHHCVVSGNGSAGFQATATGRGIMTVTVADNTFANNGAAVAVVAQQEASLRYAISNNVTTGNRTAAISVTMAKPSSGSVSGSITGNTIGRSGVAGSGASCGSCNGIAVWAIGDGRLSARIEENTIRQVDGAAIRAGAGDGAAEARFVISGNRIEEPAGAPPSAIRVQSGSSGTDRTVVCATIGGAGAAANQIGAGWGSGVDLVNRFPGTVFHIAGYHGDGKNLSAVAAHVSADNRNAAAKAALTKAPEGNAFSGADACTIEP